MTANGQQGQLTTKSEPGEFWNPHWWNRRTKLERTLCLITITALLMVSVMAATLATFGYLYQKDLDSQKSLPTSSKSVGQESQNSVCLTHGCVKAAAAILLNIDETVNPCDDFYQFACGGWLNRQVIPEDKSSVSAYTEVADDIKLELKVLLDKKLTGSEPKFIEMLKLMYDTCMDLNSIEKSGSEPLKAILKALGGWPVVEGPKWEERNFNWIEMLKAFRMLGYSHSILLDLAVTIDYKNSTVHTIKLDQTWLGAPDRSYLIQGLNDSTTAAYFKVMVKSAMLLGVDEDTAKNELLEALHFETALANFSLPQEERRNVTKLYNKYTIEKLKQKFPQIPWLKYFDALLDDKLYENDTVIVAVPDFISKFADLITSTEKRVVANYMIWRVVTQCLLMLSKAWRNLVQEYSTVVTGESQEAPRWKQCIDSLTVHLEIALSSYYVKHYFKEESKDTASELVTYIHKEFLNILEEIDWMGKETKKQAKDKANTISIHIGYPDELLNNTAVLDYYKNLIITDKSYFNSTMRLKKFSADYYMSQLRKPNIKGEWKQHAGATAVNAYAFFLENSIELPAGILQTPFFSKDMPQYMNFGAIGSVIGHEITHGFDDMGRQYDKDGNNINWWDETTDELFNQKAQCIIDQYSNYTENGMKLNGVTTQGENIADNGGLKEAYWAYRSWVKDHGEEQLLPGVKFTQNQLFWISAAKASCGKYRPEELKISLVVDEHSPLRFRVIGPMSNLPEFAKEFNCPPDSPMVPKKRCQVW